MVVREQADVQSLLHDLEPAGDPGDRESSWRSQGQFATSARNLPEQMAPVVRNGDNGRELVMARQGMPTPPGYLKRHKVDRGVTNIRNPGSAWWKRWEGLAHRCLVPLTAFSEPERLPDGKSRPVWFARSDGQPLAFLAGIWCRWTSVRKLADGETTDDLDVWMNTPATEALQLQRPLAGGLLVPTEVLNSST